jgi:hypothetical protein
MTGLSPEIEVSPGAGIDPPSDTAQDFFTADGYSAVPYTVTAADGSKTVWIVTVKWEALDTAAEPIAAVIDDYFLDLPANAGAGGNADDPIILPLNLSLGGPGWEALLTAIQSKSKFVALDISECGISGMTATQGEFDPYLGAATGKGKIVSLILPGAATSIKADISITPAFQHFSALKSVTGGAVTSVGDHAFRNCTALKTVSLPAATTIGYDVFYGCTALKTVSLPAATTIRDSVFWDCTALETVSLPVATTIRDRTFYGCTTLETVSLPAATTICDIAFYGCTALEALSLPEAISIGRGAFMLCYALETLNIPKVTSIGRRAFASAETKPLAITLGDAVPTLGIAMFANIPDDEPGTKTVTITVPDNAAWSGIISGSPYSGAENTSDGPHWVEGFRGRGWTSGDAYEIDGYSVVNPSITLIIQAAP